MELLFAFGNNTNPYTNLATEWELVNNNKEDEICLYLWQNHNTVVIGANQNPYLELNLDNIKKDNVNIAKRRTGGGCVFHDSGNLNFSFIMDKKHYNIKKQLSVIQTGLKSIGIQAEISGRNDMTSNGKKFSGNAFYQSQNTCLHHGTLLISTDFSKMKNYLMPRPSKLKKNGVSSVESRVINLSDIMPCTPDSISILLKKAFEEVYQKKASKLDININENISKLAKEWQSEKYIFGKWKDFNPSFKESFDWGSAEIELVLENGIITETIISSDSLNLLSIAKVSKLLTGKNSNDIYNMATKDNIAMDIINLVRGKLCTN